MQVILCNFLRDQIFCDFLFQVDFWDAQYKIMETIKPRKNFNFEEDRESIDRVIENYMADTLKVTCLFIVKKGNSS